MFQNLFKKKNGGSWAARPNRTPTSRLCWASPLKGRHGTTWPSKINKPCRPGTKHGWSAFWQTKPFHLAPLPLIGKSTISCCLIQSKRSLVSAEKLHPPLFYEENLIIVKPPPTTHGQCHLSSTKAHSTQKATRSEE